MPAQILRVVRKIHLYFGVFIAPALIFFAFTGAVQTLGLHEAAGRSYKPPAWLASLGQLHKKQTVTMPSRKPQAAAAGRTPRPEGRAEHDAVPARAPQPEITWSSKVKQHLPMKIFFLIVACGLFTSTTTGIYMAYKYQRSKVGVTAVLLAGVVVPLILLRF